MSEDLLKRYKRALEGLTVGGSEYYDSPERCAMDIRNRMSVDHKMIIDLIKERNKIFAIPILGWLVRKIIKKGGV